MTHFGILAAFEKRRDPDKADIIIPHHGVFSFISWHLEGVLKDYFLPLVFPIHSSGSVLITFKALSSSLLKERFLLAVVWNVPTIFCDLAHRKYLEPSMMYIDFFVLNLIRSVPHFALGLSFGKNSRVLRHLLFLDRREQW